MIIFIRKISFAKKQKRQLRYFRLSLSYSYSFKKPSLLLAFLHAFAAFFRMRSPTGIPPAARVPTFMVRTFSVCIFA